MEVAKSTSNEIYETKGEARFWFLVWLLSLLVIAFTYLSPFFFEWISARIFIRELHSIWDWGFSWNRFWKSLVAPHCFFSGFVSVFLLKTQMEADWQSVIKAIILYFGYIALCFSLEIIQVFIPGRTIAGGDILIHMIAVFAGAAVGAFFYKFTKTQNTKFHFTLKCFAICFLILTYLSIYPICLIESKDRPLVSRLIDSIQEFPRKSDFIANVLLGWPTAWIILSLIKLRGTEKSIKGMKFLIHSAMVVLITVTTALVVESLQCFYAERVPSLYDVVFQGLGAWIASAVYFKLGFHEISLVLVILKCLGQLKLRHLSMIAFLMGFVCFEWIPWFPSIEVSSLRDGVREILLPLTESSYPWDLHWHANSSGIVALFFCSALAGIACNTILLDQLQPNTLRIVMSFATCFFGVVIESGKMIVSTKNATPILFVASIAGGLIAALILMFRNGFKMGQAPSKTP